MPVEVPPVLPPAFTGSNTDEHLITPAEDLSESQCALVNVGLRLRELGYHFITPTPATHSAHLQKVAKLRPNKDSQTDPREALRDLLGWSRALRRDDVDAVVLAGLERAGVLDDQGKGRVRSRLRFSNLGQGLYAHSAFPTHSADSVFFGPDSYRFFSFIKRHARSDMKTLMDLGCGTGAGSLGLAFERHREKNQSLRIYGVDINSRALELMAVNARINDLPVPSLHAADATEIAHSGLSADLVISNPPFLMDRDQRQYRHGGQNYGTEIPIRLLRSALSCVNPGGQVLIYSGACVVKGEDQFKSRLHPLLDSLGAGWEWQYEELDPDLFGEELLHPGYEEVERIAAVGVCLRSINY